MFNLKCNAYAKQVLNTALLSDGVQVGTSTPVESNLEVVTSTGYGLSTSRKLSSCLTPVSSSEVIRITYLSSIAQKSAFTGARL